MTIKDVRQDQKKQFNRQTSHIIASWEWGEFRKKTGVEVVRIAAFDGSKLILPFQITFHKIPKTPFTAGYCPKCPLPNKQILEKLSEVSKEKRAIFIKLEPNVTTDQIEAERVSNLLMNNKIIHSAKPIFATHTFLIDLEKSEDQLLAAAHPKTRYNIKLAQRHGVKVEEAKDEKSFEIFLKLQRETARRQKFFIHDNDYYRKMWQILKPENLVHLLLTKYQNRVLAAWILFKFGDTIYYPYGGSADIHKNLMASNLLAWEAIKLGKKLGCGVFDFWGALGENPNPADPWYGFHRFKAGYGGRLVEFVGAFDLIINRHLYSFFKLVDKLRWLILRTTKTVGFN